MSTINDAGALAILNTVGTAQIDTNAVTANEIAANAVNHSEISFGSTTGTFAAGVGVTIIPEGFHWLYTLTFGANLTLEVDVDGSFRTVGTTDSPIFCYSDGTNMRINNSSGSSRTVSYRRLG